MQVSGQTDISSIVTDLNYRGYRVADLAVKSNFEEVAYLLLSGRLPTQDELT
ncbi:MAG: 2-methylcitrate synthase, partial [Candidatus Competibacteraceae bacterium]|nr:2-methylcitrate synthase [Candidatus Competibacteraceae bacterium]